jgi:hypothetical protein
VTQPVSGERVKAVKTATPSLLWVTPVPSGPPRAIISTSVGENGVPSVSCDAWVRAMRNPAASDTATTQSSGMRVRLRISRMVLGESTALST